ncbi:unnamed protein product [Hydatigera taeniaeformis]|uniref:PUM-HD domain-containing protein n=1 Tax=Hydatigena taeniaeformis TaxID=6205 RepID=A0A0R3WI65_HYDTA|nr:unnamed protein product [Hydatigera taeniaeformis]
MTAASQSYSLRAQNRQWRIEIPEFNNREDELKSQYFQFGYYVPLERRWQSYQRHRSLPPCTLRDAIDIQRENDYIQLKHSQDKCKSMHSILSIVVSADHRFPTVADQILLSVMEYCPNYKYNLLCAL